MKQRHHFFNMYLTTTISVALVLLLIGLETVLIMSTRNLIEQVKENVTLTIILQDDADSIQKARLDNYLQIAPFINQYEYISKDDALQEHITHLGEDPSKFLGFNPLLPSYEIHLESEYTQADSISAITNKLSVFPFIHEIVYPENVVSLLDGQINTFSIILLAVALVLLIVAIVLIVNTIRLYVYSKRFLINTMKLVGATPFVIKAPIIRRNILMGLIAGLIALILLAGSLYYCQAQLGIILLPLTLVNISIVCGVVLVTGLLITGFAALIATNKYIRMHTDDLYYV